MRRGGHRMLWLQGARRRPLVWTLLVSLSTLAVAMAVLGPLLLRAVDQSTISDTITTAGPEKTSMSVFARGAGGGDISNNSTTLMGAAAAALAIVADGASERLWEPLQTWTESSANVAWSPVRKSHTDELTVRLRATGGLGCTDVVVTSGKCPTGPYEALVSDPDASARGVSAGSTLDYRISPRLTGRWTVAGTYDPARVTTPITRPGTEAPSTAVVTGDPLIVTADQLDRLVLPVQVTAKLVLRDPVHLADEPVLRGAVRELDDAALVQGQSLTVDTHLSDVLDRVDFQRTASRVLVGVVEAQALGLTLFALAVALARLARARSVEWSAGRLLGVPRPHWLRSIYLEPGSALLLGVPLGYGVGTVVGALAVRAALRAGTPVEPWRWPVLLSALVAVAVAVTALVAVTLPGLRRPLAELVSERSEAVGTTPLGAAAQTLVVVLAAGTLYVLLAGGVLGGSGPRLGLVAPAVFALALAVLGVRVATVVVRRRTARPARSLTGLVVARQAARTPSSLSPTIVVTVGVSLVVFAGQVLALSVRNQELRATAVTGASTVLTLTGARGTDLVAAVDAADPSGRYAMAARERSVPGATGTDRIVAVDTSRLSAVAAWSSAWAGVADAAAALRGTPGDPVVLSGTRLDITMSGVKVAPGVPLSDTASPAAPELQVVLDVGTRWQTVVLGRVAGRSRLSAAVPCSRGCRVVAFALASKPLEPYLAELTITGVGTDAAPISGTAAWLTTPGGWHPRVGGYYDPDPGAFAIPDAGPTGLALEFTDNQGGSAPAVAPSDVLDPLPGLLGPATIEQPFAGIPDAASGTGLDGSPQLVRVVGRAAVLPRALDDGVLVDLRTAQDLVNPQNDSSAPEVWLAPDAPSSVEQSLTSAGYTVTARERLTDTRTALLREPTTRAASVARTVALSAALLTLLAMIAARVIDAPRRRTDWRSLADAGLRGRTLRRLAATEVAIPALLGIVLGTASGLVAVRLTAARLPLVDLSTPGPPLDLTLAFSEALLVGLTASVIVLLFAGIAGAAETRQVATS